MIFLNFRCIQEIIENEGVMTRTLRDLFSQSNADKMKIAISFIEIYNEKVFDLMSDNSNEQINVKGKRFYASDMNYIVGIVSFVQWFYVL